MRPVIEITATFNYFESPGYELRAAIHKWTIFAVMQGVFLINKRITTERDSNISSLLLC